MNSILRLFVEYSAKFEKCSLLFAGNRDIVGPGYNNMASYIDHPMNPCPAIRFKENTADVAALRQKEKGDWKKLSLEEKKQR